MKIFQTGIDLRRVRCADYSLTLLLASKKINIAIVLIAAVLEKYHDSCHRLVALNAWISTILRKASVFVVIFSSQFHTNFIWVRAIHIRNRTSFFLFTHRELLRTQKG